MPTVVDSLIVEFGIDASQWDEGEKKVSSSLRRMTEEGEKSSKHVSGSTDKMTSAFALLQGRVLGIAALFLGGMGVKQFVEQITAATAALGRASVQLGTSVKELDSWKKAGQLVGASADEMIGSIDSLNHQIVQFQITGQSSLVPYLNYMGIQLRNNNGGLKTSTELLMEMSKWAQGKDARMMAEWFREMGMSPGMTTLLLQGPNKVKQLVDEMGKLAPKDDEVKKLTSLQTAWEHLKIQSEAYGRTLTSTVAPGMERVITWADKLVEKLRTMAENMANSSFGEGMASMFKNLAEVIEAPIKAIDNLLSNLEKLADWVDQHFGWLDRLSHWLGFTGPTVGDAIRGKGSLAKQAGIDDIGKGVSGGGAAESGGASGAEEKGASSKGPAPDVGPVLDVPGNTPASERYNNPGAQYPAPEAKAFGMEGYGVIGGGHKIAKFPDMESGAAANMDLLKRKYVGMTIGDAASKWSGGGRSAVEGYDAGTVITPEMANDPKFMKPFFKSMAKAESGRDSPMTDKQWDKAFEYYQQGHAPGSKPYSEADNKKPIPFIPESPRQSRRAQGPEDQDQQDQRPPTPEGQEEQSRKRLGPAAAVDVAMEHFGQHERLNNEELSAFFHKQGYDVDPATTKWCAYYVNANLKAAGVKGSGSGLAASFYKWGVPVEGAPRRGDVLVTPSSEGSGHVGFATGVTIGEYHQRLSGNHNDRVEYDWVREGNYTARREDPRMTAAREQSAGDKADKSDQPPIPGGKPDEKSRPPIPGVGAGAVDSLIKSGFFSEGARTTNSNTTSNEMHVGNITVNTQATDAYGLAKDLRPALERNSFMNQGNYGHN